jgi:putative aldouronate transport system substrate-binding protein
MIRADFNQIGSVSEQIEVAQPEAEWVQVANPAGPGGPSAVPFPPFPTHFFGIPTSLADEPEKLAKVFELVNYVSTQEGRELTAYGIEGVDWEMIDGEPKLTDEALEKSQEERGFSWMYQLAGRDEAPYLKRGGTPYTGEQVDFAVEHPILPIYNTLVTNPEGYNPADADRYGEEQLVQFITGQRSLDEYDEFLDTLSTTFGYQEFVEHAIAQLTELGIEQ